MLITSDQRGLTLIELIISILVISIALGGILLVMNFTTLQSVDPMLQQQGVTIAESYLEEILLKPYDDPDGIDTEGANRTLYDDVDDYNNLPDTLVRDQDGTAIATLASYRVAVTVAAETLNGVDSRRVDVSVTLPGGQQIELSGYRANY